MREVVRVRQEQHDDPTGGFIGSGLYTIKRDPRMGTYVTFSMHFGPGYGTRTYNIKSDVFWYTDLATLFYGKLRV